MPSEHEIQFHRSFLSYKLALKIWNDAHVYQNTPGGPPGRQKQMDSDPVFAYHVRQGPQWPSKAPGLPPDRKYDALLARSDGGLEPLVIVSKRGMTGQKFASAATPWELINSVLCGGGKFLPVVNSMMEVTGHYSNVRDAHLIHPEEINFSDPAEYIANQVPIFLYVAEKRDWDGKWVGFYDAPSGWKRFREFHGGIDVVVLPNGEVIGASGNRFSRNNGQAISVMSPLDFWAPGSRLVAAGIRGLTTKMSAATVRALKVLTVPTKELAALSAARFSRKTLPGIVAPKTLPVTFQGRKALVLGDDMATVTRHATQIPNQPGLYDVIVHGDKTGFFVLKNNAWQEVSVRDLATALRPKLGPNDKIRLIGCETGVRGGPAQQLANELGRNVFAPTTAVYPTLGSFYKASHRQFNQIQGAKVYESVKGHLIEVMPDKFGKYAASRGGELVKFVPGKSLVPVDGGAFTEVVAQRGATQLAGKGGKSIGNEASGEISKAR